MLFQCALFKQAIDDGNLRHAISVEEAAMRYFFECHRKTPDIIYVKDVNGAVHTVRLELVATVIDTKD